MGAFLVVIGGVGGGDGDGSAGVVVVGGVIVVVVVVAWCAVCGVCVCVCVCVVRKASREAPPPIYNFQRCRRAQFHGSVQEINHLPTSFLLKKEENLNSKIKDRMDYKCQQYSVKNSNLCWFVCF